MIESIEDVKKDNGIMIDAHTYLVCLFGLLASIFQFAYLYFTVRMGIARTAAFSAGTGVVAVAVALFWSAHS